MIIYDLTVARQRIHGADRISLAAHANETLALRFHFDRHWREFDSKAVIFRNHAGEYYIIELHNNIARIPWEVLTHDGEIEISVIAFEDEIVLTTNKVNINVSESLMPEEYLTYSPSETLFDRFKKECTAQAFLDYKDEIENMKRDYERRIVSLGEEINSANARTEEVRNEKNNEIAEINHNHSAELRQLNDEIANKNERIDYLTEKAYKWDMIDYALSLKTSAAQALWNEGTDKYALPMMNTKNIKTISSSHFSNNLTEIGMNLESATSLNSVFSGKQGIKKIVLTNTDNISSWQEAFKNCSSLRILTIGNVKNANSLYSICGGCTSLEKITFGKLERITSMLSSFTNCTVLREIEGVFDCTLVSDFSYAFDGCANLEAVSFKENTIRNSISLANSVKLNKDSMQSLFEGLCDEVSKTVTISKYAFDNNFATDDEQEEILDYITDVKGWTLTLR